MSNKSTENDYKLNTPSCYYQSKLDQHLGKNGNYLSVPTDLKSLDFSVKKMQKEVKKNFSNYEVTNQNQMRKKYEDKIREENKRIAEV